VADIKNGDVETYIRLLISEELGFTRDDSEHLELSRKEDKRKRKLQLNQWDRRDEPDRMEDTSDD
jgi:hypothetical protein